MFYALNKKMVHRNNDVSPRFRRYNIRPLGYKKVYLPLYKVADVPFHIQGAIYGLDLA